MANNQSNASESNDQDKRNAREKLVERARTEYGITNAETMSDSQLKAEVKALDEQAKTDSDTSKTQK